MEKSYHRRTSKTYDTTTHATSSPSPDVGIQISPSSTINTYTTNPNPNNGRPGQPMQAARLATYPNYSISSLECNDIHLQSTKTLTKEQTHVSIEYLNEEVPNE
jgi:hypothetical protein